MAIRTPEYWAKRFEQLEASQHNKDVKYYAEVEKLFKAMQTNIQKETDAWFGRFADNNNMTIQEAKKLLKAEELEEFKWSVNEYIEYGRAHAGDPKWLKKLENASAKFHISRLEALSIHTQAQSEKAFGDYNESMDGHIKDVYTSGFYHTAYEVQKGVGVFHDIIGIDAKTLERVITKPWTPDGLNFSDRIWRSKAQLIDALQKEVMKSCIMGQSTYKGVNQLMSLTNAFEKNVKTARSQAARLIQTESAYFGALSRQDCFKSLDVEQFEVVATLDGRTSEICREMDGKHFPMNQYEIGVTAPPFHVNCRSTTCPYFDDEFTADEYRAERGQDGKTHLTMGNMTYNEWLERVGV